MTPKQVKEKLLKEGKTQVALAKELGCSYRTLHAVINGMNKGHRGEAHRVAVALGLKEAA